VGGLDGNDSPLLLSGLPVKFTELDFDNGRVPAPAGGVLFLLKVVEQSSLTGNPMSGLVLQRTSAADGEYCRVSVWSITNWAGLPKLFPSEDDEEEWNPYGILQDMFDEMMLEEGQFEEVNCE
jgi:hypothetical protein